MKKLLLIGCLLPLAASLQISCTQVAGERVGHAADSDMGGAIKDLRRASRGDFREMAYPSNSITRAKEFVAAAQRGDVQKMMDMTSAITLRNDGTGRTRHDIYPRVVRDLSGARIVWKGRPQPMTDETGNKGFIIAGEAVKEGGTPFYIVVLNEGGRHVVAGIRRKL